MATLLEVVDVSKRFGGVHVIEDFNFHVAEGEALGIVGPNGAGKTTLLNLIAGDLRPDRGTILLEGVDITRQPAHDRCRRGIGRTAQIPRPFEGLTVFENVLIGSTFGAAGRLHGTADGAAVGALETTGMADKANVIAGTLTLLQRKRLELARALATQPNVLLLDEIAGGLTEAEILELVTLIEGIRSTGVAIVWIEHIVHALLRVVDRMMAMNTGRKLIEGDPHEVMASSAVRAVYLGEEFGEVAVSDSLLDIEALDVSYGDFQALFGIDLHVAPAETVSIIGANGAGKSTLLKTIVGLVPIGSGTITYAGTSVTTLSAPRRVEQGISLVLEGRRIFPSLTVEDNLAVGSFSKRTGPWNKERVVAAFPLLGPLLKRNSAAPSGGEQQALAIGRALMSNPDLLLLDEVSLGLAPIVVKQVYQAIPAIKEQGTTVLLVEQDVNQALSVADRFYCLLEGRVSLAGVPAGVTKDQITEGYFGLDRGHATGSGAEGSAR